MENEEPQKQLQELKQQIAKLGMPIPGSIQTAHLRCGKKNCQCHQSDDHRHGPYFLWYRRINGKLRTQSIKEEDLELFESWIKNREKLGNLVQKIIDLGADFADHFKSLPNKLKNPSSEMRGK